MCCQPSRSESQKMSSPPLTGCGGVKSIQDTTESLAIWVVLPVSVSITKTVPRFTPREAESAKTRPEPFPQRGLWLKFTAGDSGWSDLTAFLESTSTTNIVVIGTIESPGAAHW